MKERAKGVHKSVECSSYAPFIQLDCCLCRAIAEGQTHGFETPLVVVDVGAARGFNTHWDLFGERCIQIGFEPDLDEYNGVKATYASDPTKHILPFALADSKGRRTLYVPRDQDGTSLFRPYTPFFSRLPDPTLTIIENTIEVETTTLDECSLPATNQVDVIKVDVEGAELLVLQGSESRLKNEVLCVIAEVSLMRRYHEQPMFADVDIYLRSLGFQLFDIDFRRWRRKKLPGAFDGVRVGQAVYGDVLYLKDPVESPQQFCRSDLKREKLLKLVALSESFSMPDYSLELLEVGVEQKYFSTAEAAELRELLLKNTVTKFNDRNRIRS